MRRAALRGKEVQRQLKQGRCKCPAACSRIVCSVCVCVCVSHMTSVLVQATAARQQDQGSAPHPHPGRYPLGPSLCTLLGISWAGLPLDLRCHYLPCVRGLYFVAPPYPLAAAAILPFSSVCEWGRGAAALLWGQVTGPVMGLALSCVRSTYGQVHLGSVVWMDAWQRASAGVCPCPALCPQWWRGARWGGTMSPPLVGRLGRVLRVSCVCVCGPVEGV